MVTEPQPNETPQKPAIEKFFEDGVAFIASAKATTKKVPCFAIEPGTGEWDQWAAYLLARCGRLPRVMRACLDGRFQSFTVPARWPEWFDMNWVPPLDVPKSQRWRPYVPSDEERARNLAKLEALKRDLAGAISMRKASERAKRAAPDPYAAYRTPQPQASIEASPELKAIMAEKAAKRAAEDGAADAA